MLDIEDVPLRVAQSMFGKLKSPISIMAAGFVTYYYYYSSVR